MLMPSIFNDNLFDDFFDFPFYDDKADRKIQRKTVWTSCRQSDEDRYQREKRWIRTGD